MSAIIDAIRNAHYDAIDLTIVSGLIGSYLFFSHNKAVKKEKQTREQEDLAISERIKRKNAELTAHNQISNQIQIPNSSGIINPKPNNKKNLVDIKKSLERTSTLLSRYVYHTLLWSGYEKISIMRNDFKTLSTDREWTKEEFQFFIEYANLLNLNNEIEKIKDTISKISTFTTDVYDELIDDIFSNVDGDASHLKPSFSLPPDKRIEQQSRIKSIMTNLFSDAFQTIDNSIRSQQFIQQNKAQFDSVTSDNINWAGLLKNFGAGALAAANPFIGIPMVLVNMFGESESAKRKQEFINHYIQKACECTDGYDSAARKIHIASVNSADYWLGRSQELH